MKRLLLALLVVGALGGGALAYYLTRSVDGPLTGQPAGRDIANRRPVAVILDNYSPFARPQTGLDNASLVFETLTEGGITRFMAVYLERDAATIGPIRSSRLYFNSWAAALGAIFGHDGGNVDALQQLPSLRSVYNEDSGRISGPFHRVSSRESPHNEYTGSAELRAYAGAHGGSATGIGMSLRHKRDTLAFQRPGTSYLHVQFSYAEYNVAWQYNPGSNDYLRFMGGAAHVDAVTGKQLRANNVVVMFTTKSPASDPYTSGAINMRTEGTGKATIYEDGKAIAATWRKDSVDAPLQWSNASGGPIELNGGNTWVEVVPEGNAVSTSASP